MIVNEFRAMRGQKRGSFAKGTIEAHIFIAFLAYCLHVTLARRLPALAPGLTPHSVLEKFAGVQMIDVHLRPPTAASWCSPAIPRPNPSSISC